MRMSGGPAKIDSKGKVTSLTVRKNAGHPTGCLALRCDGWEIARFTPHSAALGSENRWGR